MVLLLCKKVYQHGFAYYEKVYLEDNSSIYCITLKYTINNSDEERQSSIGHSSHVMFFEIFLSSKL